MAETTTAASADTVTTEWAEDFGERWLAAWNSHEPERLFELMADDIEYHDSAWPQTMRGHAQVGEFLDYTWRAFPDMTFEAVGGPLVASDGPRAAFQWRGQATNSGPIDPPGMPATGKRVEFEGADFHEYRDGKVAKLRIVFDTTDLARQMGLMPDRGSVGERAMVLAQRLRARLGR
jgi:steroid delta-isomerase-like uncharacterized protein